MTIKTLNKVQVSEFIGFREADFSNTIWIYVPSTAHEQPIIMYTSTINGEQTKHFLCTEIKAKLSAGMHTYKMKAAED